MLKTKDRILLVALKQLNDKGLDKLSIRSIADEVGISAGNLAYHYKNIDVIIYQLYLQLVKKLGDNIVKFMVAEPNVQWMLNQNEHTFQIMWEYKFLLLDFTAITRRIPDIKFHFRALIVQRKVQMKILFDKWIAEGIFVEERVEGMYEKFILSSIILYNAWIPDAQVHFNKSRTEIATFYADLFINLMVPFLTEKGLEDYKEAIKYRPKTSLAEYPEGI